MKKLLLIVACCSIFGFVAQNLRAMIADNVKDQTSAQTVRSMQIESSEQIKDVIDGEVQQLDELSIHIAEAVDDANEIKEILAKILEKIDGNTLKKLDLGGNGLSGHLKKLGLQKFTGLTDLNLQDNDNGIWLGGIFDKLPNLQRLNLQGCKLFDMPPSIGRLTNLVYLNLSYNLLPKEIISHISKLTGLQELLLTHNRIEPKDLDSYEALQKIAKF